MIDVGTVPWLGKQNWGKDGNVHRAEAASVLLLSALILALKTETEQLSPSHVIKLPGCEQGHQLLGFQLLRTSLLEVILRIFASEQGACGG